MTTIYKITNPKGKIYIGQTTNYRKRLNHKSKNKDSSSGNKPIDVFDKHWNFIKSYDSILEASKDLKIGRWIIDKFLAGTTKKPYKYRFKYKDITE